MKIPPFTRQVFTEKSGFLSSPFQYFFDVLVQQMQENLSDDGLVVPSLTTQEINDVADPTNDNSMPNGTLWYDTDTNELKLKKNGVVVVII